MELTFHSAASMFKLVVIVWEFQREGGGGRGEGRGDVIGRGECRNKSSVYDTENIPVGSCRLEKCRGHRHRQQVAEDTSSSPRQGLYTGRGRLSDIAGTALGRTDPLTK